TEVFKNVAELYIETRIMHEPFNNMPALKEVMELKFAEIKKLGQTLELSGEELDIFIRDAFPATMQEYFKNEGGLELYLHNQTISGEKKGLADPGVELGVYELEMMGQMY